MCSGMREGGGGGGDDEGVKSALGGRVVRQG